MNEPSKLGTRKSKLKAKNGAANLPKVIDGCGIISASSMTSKGGCFGFLSSNTSTKKPPLRRHEVAPRTPASAPALNRPRPSMFHAKSSRNAHLDGDSSKCNIVTSKKLGAGGDGSRPKWNRWKLRKGEKRFDFDEGLGGNTGSCSAATPEKSVLGVSAAAERKEKVEGTPNSTATPYVKASISPEVPSGASTVNVTPVCFATGHMFTGVLDAALRTPASAPALNRPRSSVLHAMPSRNAHLDDDSSKCDIVTSKKLGAGGDGSRPKWNQWKARKVEKRFDFDEGLGGKTGSCSATTPKKSVSGVSAAAERKEKTEGTPTSPAIPPAEASISPEVPWGASTESVTPACFSTVHMFTGVFDWRKRRPRGVLAARGRGQQEVAESYDTTRVSSAPPPLVEASINWLSSDTADAKSSPSSNHRVHRGHSPKGSEGADDMHRDDILNFVLGTKASVDQGLWSFCSNHSGMSGSLKPSTLFDFNSPFSKPKTSAANTLRIPSLVDHDLCEFSPASSNTTVSLKLSETSSSGINIQKTPSTGDSVSPFSLILENVSKTAKHKFARPQQEQGERPHGFNLEKSLFAADALKNNNMICIPTSSSCIKQLTLSPIDMVQLEEVLGSVRFSPETATDTKDGQTSSSRPSFQFENPRISLNPVDLDHLQKPSFHKIFPTEEIAVEEHKLSSNGTRISWHEGLVSRMFEMGELDCSHWFSDYEDNCTCGEDGKLEYVSDPQFGNVTRSFVLDRDDDQHMSASLGSTEFAFETVTGKSENIVPSITQISCAESISTKNLQLSSSNDSEWTIYYKNHLFEI